AGLPSAVANIDNRGLESRSFMAKVLLADDDYSLLVMLSAWLKHEDHHIVETARDGEQALDLLLSYPFDCVVMDWEMPKMDGIEVCKRVREKNKKIPILLLTARETIEDRIAGLDAGADDYLTKPFAAGELSARIRTLLRRANQVELEAIKSDSIEIEKAGHSVTLDGKELNLAPREYDLLEFLMRHPGEVFSPEALMARVWPDKEDASVAAVRVAVQRVRSKLTDASGKCPLTTVRGSGYRWDGA
ncbi:MAG TPA: response regulator transcription factor, partial [Candidatus Melainabacteria bacterium]|nr:response regulator transcription factor [Candidatus Melainabacteria bacterium]